MARYMISSHSCSCPARFGMQVSWLQLWWKLPSISWLPLMSPLSTNLRSRIILPRLFGFSIDDDEWKVWISCLTMVRVERKISDFAKKCIYVSLTPLFPVFSSTSAMRVSCICPRFIIWWLTISFCMVSFHESILTIQNDLLFLFLFYVTNQTSAALTFDSYSMPCLMSNTKSYLGFLDKRETFSTHPTAVLDRPPEKTVKLHGIPRDEAFNKFTNSKTTICSILRTQAKPSSIICLH